MAYIGNSPGVASQRVETAFTATASQTVFTPSSGYTLGYCDVYYNGVKLVNGDDYTAADGVSITLATAAAEGDSVVVVASFPRGLTDGYLKAEADAKYVALTGDQTIAGVKTFSGSATVVNGNLGVGTSSVLGNSTLNAALGIVVRNQSTTTGYFQTYNANAGTDLKTWRWGGDGSGNLVFQTVNDAYSSATGRMTLDPAGRLLLNNATAYNECVLTIQESASLASAIAFRNRNSNQTWSLAVDVNTVDDKRFGLFDVTNQQMRFVVDTAGQAAVGTVPNSWASGYRTLQFVSASGPFVGGSDYALQVGANTYVNTSNQWVRGGAAYKPALMTSFNGEHAFYTAGTGAAGSSISWFEAIKITGDGYFYVNDGYSSTNHRTTLKVPQGALVLCVSSYGYSGVNADIALFYSVTTGGANGAGTAMVLGRNGGTNRSINAGGTINASGADYAEYMTKAGDFTIQKGDVVGVDSNGKLTNVFADAVSFVVKSTDPSYVGGDTWGSSDAIGPEPERPKTDWTEEQNAQYEIDRAAYDAALEAARQLVDRIAFSGQVPVNVTGATPGQFIIPVNDNGGIAGQAVSNPTFEQYQIAVGKVIAIEEDGRARIIVKVA